MIYVINFLKKYLREILYSVSFSFLFILFLIIGNNLDKFNTFCAKFNIIPYFFKFVFLSLICFLFFKNLSKIEKFIYNIEVFPKLKKIFFEDNKKSFWNCFWLIALCHLPAFIAYFPGIFNYDVYYQLNVFVIPDPIEIHPITHSLMVYAIWLFERIFHTGWVGVFIYTIIQSAIIIAIYAYCMKLLSRYNTAYIIRFFSLLFFALYPPNQVFHLITTKDVYFCGFVMLFICFMIELILDREKFLNSKHKKILLTLTVILMFLFRHNGLHAYILCLPFFAIFFRKDIKKLIAVFLFPLIFMCCFSFVKSFAGLEPPSSASSLGVPLQQMARVKNLKGSYLPNSDIQDYIELVSKEKENFYYPFEVDRLKFDKIITSQRSDNIENFLKTKSKRFIEMYLSWGKKYPIIYIDAFLFNTYKFWYVNASYNKYGYPHSYLLLDSWFGNVHGVEVVKSYFILPYTYYLYNDLLVKNSFSQSYLCTMFFAFAWNSWFLIFCFWILFYKRRFDFITTLLIIPALFITALLGPVAVIRYIWQNYQVIPIILAFCIGNFRK